MKKIELETDQAKTYFNPSDAVTDQGFGRQDDTFIKAGKKYKMVSYDHYNTTIYSVTLKEIK